MSGWGQQSKPQCLLWVTLQSHMHSLLIPKGINIPSRWKTQMLDRLRRRNNNGDIQLACYCEITSHFFFRAFSLFVDNFWWLIYITWYKQITNNQGVASTGWYKQVTSWPEPNLCLAEAISKKWRSEVDDDVNDLRALLSALASRATRWDTADSYVGISWSPIIAAYSPTLVDTY